MWFRRVQSQVPRGASMVFHCNNSFRAHHRMPRWLMAHQGSYPRPPVRTPPVASARTASPAGLWSDIGLTAFLLCYLISWLGGGVSFPSLALSLQLHCHDQLSLCHRLSLEQSCVVREQLGEWRGLSLETGSLQAQGLGRLLPRARGKGMPVCLGC